MTCKIENLSILISTFAVFSLDFTPGTGDILLKGMTCNGTESHLNQCTHDGWYGTDGGNHYRDVGLKCGGTYRRAKTASKGRV